MTPSKVFISYAREDQEAALRLYHALQQVGCDPWIDSEDLPAGAVWLHEIRTTIRQSRFFVVLLSKRSMTKRGFVHREIREALAIVQELPETERFLLPIRLEACDITHETLRELHWIDLFPDWNQGFEKLLKSIGCGNSPRSPVASQIADLSSAAKHIERSLGILIGAYFREARILLLEENIDALKERLTKAVAADELDLPSLALYCHLLAHTNRLSLAKSYYRDLVRRFGPHSDIFPEDFVSRLGETMAELESIARIDEIGPSEFGLAVDGWFAPNDVWCTSWGIVSLWKHRSLFYRLGDFAPKLVVHDWNGKRLLEIQERSLAVINATGEYVAIRSSKTPTTRVVSITRAQEVRSAISERELECLFPGGSSVSRRLTDVRLGATAEFKGAMLRFEAYDYYEVQTISRPYSSGVNYDYKKREAGKITITFPVGRL